MSVVLVTLTGVTDLEPERSEHDHPELVEPPLPRSMWLLSDNRRSMIALAAAVPLSVLVLWVLLTLSPELAEVVEPDRSAAALLGAVTAWTLFAAAHTGLTWLVFTGLRGEDLRSAVTADPQWHHRDDGGRHRAMRWLLGSGAWSWSVSMSVLALLVVIAMLLQPSLRSIPTPPLLAVVMVAVSWVNVAVTYAVHHARVDTTYGVFEFPGDAPASLLDYLYLSVGVQATFGTTDVQVCSSRGRRLVLTQSVLAFGFNTVIIGMVISLLVGLS